MAVFKEHARRVGWAIVAAACASGSRSRPSARASAHLTPYTSDTALAHHLSALAPAQSVRWNGPPCMSTIRLDTSVRHIQAAPNLKTDAPIVIHGVVRDITTSQGLSGAGVQLRDRTTTAGTKPDGSF